MAFRSNGREFPDTSQPHNNFRRLKAFLSAWSAHGLVTLVSGGVILIIVHFFVAEWSPWQSSPAADKHLFSAGTAFLSAAIEPLIDDTGDELNLSSATISRLDQLLSQPVLAANITNFSIISRDGLIIYASDHRRIGRRYSDDTSDTSALAGLRQSFEGETAITAFPTGATPYQTVFVPIRPMGRSGLTAVAVIETGSENQSRLSPAPTIQAWLIAATLAFVVGAFFSRVRANESLLSKPSAAGSPMQISTAAQTDIQRPPASVSDHSFGQEDRRRIRDVLHDGPAQSLALALLRIDDIPVASGRDRETIGLVRSATRSALDEIRSIASELTRSPEKGVSVAAVVATIVDRFATTRRTIVEADIAADVQGRLPNAWASSIAGLVHECLLFNAETASAARQRLQVRCLPEHVCIWVACQEDQSAPLAGHPGALPRALDHCTRTVYALGGRVELKTLQNQSVHMCIVIPSNHLIA